MRHIALVLLSLTPSMAFAGAGRAADNSADVALSAGERTAIIVECEQISTSYGYFLDTADADGFADLFAADGKLELVAAHKVITGNAALHDFGLQPPNARIFRHVITNFRLKVLDKDHAEGTAEMLVFVYDKDPTKNDSFQVNLIGRLDDQYVRTPTGWRFELRRLDANLSRNYTSNRP